MKMGYKKVEFSPKTAQIPTDVVNQIFKDDFGKTLHLNSLQLRMKKLKSWYIDEGYSLARVSGPNSVNPDGTIQLNVVEGLVAGVEVHYFNKEG